MIYIFRRPLRPPCGMAYGPGRRSRELQTSSTEVEVDSGSGINKDHRRTETLDLLEGGPRGSPRWIGWGRAGCEEK